MNNSLCPESEISISAKKNRMIMKELVKGQESATQLKVLLEKPFGSEGSLSCQELTANVLRSFTQAISIINSSSADEVAHRSLLNSGQNGSPVAVSGENRSQKGRRGRYNRRLYSYISSFYIYSSHDKPFFGSRFGLLRVFLDLGFVRKYGHM